MNQGLAAHAAPFQAIASVDQGPDISETYLEEARQYREQGRYELARQMTDEISRWLVNAGYRYQELRKGSYIRFDRGTGELILTREVRKLTSTRGTGQAILAGTYVVSGEQVRFSMSLIHTTSNEVLAKGTATVPITDDLLPLLEDQPLGSGKVPTVYTRLQ